MDHANRTVGVKVQASDEQQERATARSLQRRERVLKAYKCAKVAWNYHCLFDTS